jgi:hypothetical protein
MALLSLLSLARCARRSSGNRKSPGAVGFD